MSIKMCSQIKIDYVCKISVRWKCANKTKTKTLFDTHTHTSPLNLCKINKICIYEFACINHFVWKMRMLCNARMIYDMNMCKQWLIITLTLMETFLVYTEIKSKHKLHIARCYYTLAALEKYSLSLFLSICTTSFSWSRKWKMVKLSQKGT